MGKDDSRELARVLADEWDMPRESVEHLISNDNRVSRLVSKLRDGNLDVLNDLHITLKLALVGE